MEFSVLKKLIDEKSEEGFEIAVPEWQEKWFRDYMKECGLFHNFYAAHTVNKVIEKPGWFARTFFNKKPKDYWEDLELYPELSKDDLSQGSRIEVSITAVATTAARVRAIVDSY